MNEVFSLMMLTLAMIFGITIFFKALPSNYTGHTAQKKNRSRFDYSPSYEPVKRTGFEWLEDGIYD